jgi:hypothetical protein
MRGAPDSADFSVRSPPHRPNFREIPSAPSFRHRSHELPTVQTMKGVR